MHSQASSLDCADVQVCELADREARAQPLDPFEALERDRDQRQALGMDADAEASGSSTHPPSAAFPSVSKQIQSLQSVSEAIHRDDYKLNSALRRANRAARRSERALLREGQALGWHPTQGGVKLLPKSAGDGVQAKQQRRMGIRAQSTSKEGQFTTHAGVLCATSASRTFKQHHCCWRSTHPLCFFQVDHLLLPLIRTGSFGVT